LLDVHVYHCFDEGERQASFQEHIRIACTDDKAKVDAQTMKTIVGEWSVGYKLSSEQADTEPFPTCKITIV
jgi:hypothetical protein